MLVFIPTSFTSVLSPGHIVKFVPLNNSRLLLDELPHIVLHDHALHLLCRHGLGATVDVNIFLSCYLFHPISWQAMEDKSVRRTLLKVQLIKEIILQRIDHPDFDSYRSIGSSQTNTLSLLSSCCLPTQS